MKNLSYEIKRVGYPLKKGKAKNLEELFLIATERQACEYFAGVHNIAKFYQESFKEYFLTSKGKNHLLKIIEAVTGYDSIEMLVTYKNYDFNHYHFLAVQDYKNYDLKSKQNKKEFEALQDIIKDSKDRLILEIFKNKGFENEFLIINGVNIKPYEWEEGSELVEYVSRGDSYGTAGRRDYNFKEGQGCKVVTL